MKSAIRIFGEIAIVILGLALFCFVVDPYPLFRRIVPLPPASLGIDHFVEVGTFLVVILAITFSVTHVIAGPLDWRQPRRLAKELYALGAGISLAAFASFLATSLVFSAQLILGLGLFSLIAFLAIGAIAAGSGAVRHVVDTLAASLRLMITAGGIAALLVMMSPVVLAVAFAKDRNVANVVTQVRMYFSERTGDLPFTLVNAFPGVTFYRPIAIQFSPNDPTLAFVLERGGTFYSIRADGTEKELLLDISDEVGTIDFENGALGFDLHPDFGTDGKPGAGWCFIYYTSVQPGSQINRLTRFDLSLADPAARKASATRLISFSRNPDGFHNGGSVEFGPDRFLYLAVGETSDPKGWQTVDRSFAGGIFRIDVDQTGGDVSHPIPRQPVSGETGNYYIPNDNPFVGRPNTLEEFFALGLRNPFRISFDSATNKIWAGEVGSIEWEEVNVIQKGHNYQFPYIEGESKQQPAKPDPLIGTETPPVHFYHHTANDRSVIGGSVYRGARYQELVGRYIFGDNYSGKIWEMPATGEAVKSPRLIARATQYAQRGLTSLVNAPDGRFLITTLGANNREDGRIWSLVPTESKEAAAAESETPSAGDTVSEADTLELYNSVCARCHGVAGLADGPDSKELGGRFPNFASPEFHAKRTDAHIYDVIKEGGLKFGLSEMMQPFGDILSDAEIDFLAKHVRSLQKPDGGPEHIEYPKPETN